MNDKSLYEKILGITAPWHVTDVRMELSSGSITVVVEHAENATFRCPECNSSGPIHDHRVKRWRHLPTCHLRTVIEARTPRITCPNHGVRQVRVDWADGNSSFTSLFEALVIQWLAEASISAVRRMMELSWDQVDTIRRRAVQRGLARRKKCKPKALGIDETSFQKRHEYVTVIVDQKTHAVMDVLDDRKQQTLQSYFEALTRSQRKAVKTIAMDMWDPYIAAVRNTFEAWEQKICFDRFHVSSHYGKALDKTRTQEHRHFIKQDGESILKHTKHHWLRNSSRTDNRSRRWFLKITRKNLKTARAWAIKETAAQLWDYSTRGHAMNAWKRLISWMRRSRLEPMKNLSKTIGNYLWGIVNAPATI
ncbi:MAG: ISL3 family transposase [Chitinivibrionales bacterium]|nr:ISL3 family transposase [Chitinivibrionales bacterium]